MKILRGIKSAAANELNSLSRTAYARDTFQSQYFLAMNFKIVKSAKLPRLFGLLESVSGFCSYSAQAQFSHTPKKKKKKKMYINRRLKAMVPTCAQPSVKSHSYSHFSLHLIFLIRPLATGLQQTKNPPNRSQLIYHSHSSYSHL